MDILQQLLTSINSILEKDKAEKEVCARNGDSFNLFRALDQSTSELIHSRLIAELLNPKGCHGEKNKRMSGVNAHSLNLFACCSMRSDPLKCRS